MMPKLEMNTVGNAVMWVLGVLALSCVGRIGWEIGGRIWAIL